MIYTVLIIGLTVLMIVLVIGGIRIMHLQAHSLDNLVKWEFR